MSRVQVVATAWLAFVIGLICFQALFAQRSGALALSQVFEPYIAITGLVAAAVAGLSSSRPGRVLAVLLVGVLVLRCAPSLASVPRGPSSDAFEVMTWNVFADDAAARTVDAVRNGHTSYVGLQELQPDAARALEADPIISERLPYRALEPDGSVFGIGLLSEFPILEHSVSVHPAFIRAVVQQEPTQPTIVYVIHPMPARIRSLGRIPVALDTIERDAAIALIRSQVDTDLAAGHRVLVMGDLNTTEREPAYHDMSRGLIDAHLEAGLGPGLTWRPGALAWLPVGLLRIDYVFASPTFKVHEASVDCYPGSDHCAVHATISGAQP